MAAMPRYEYDPDADAIYVHLSDKEYSHGEDLSPEGRVDFAVNGSPVGVELTCVSSRAHRGDLPSTKEIAALVASLNIRTLV